ncbi:type II toxin-antitoxin system RelE/ParE family toxin [Mucilaginibacter robiniae]|uniref:Type II toxin-antitoxin system RelE/ParE family toxin n=1 Tax=Mucilaginibacter robiniae TaxID=2728022 RepID=A0A7L5DYD1_9SPHI|nr:type II toxin-antitoxin system RelE/ParE family toxin [Mucilaginibacter robiniae]QJD95781.1 type II toxin-antitoxin system RelE/ParE family toxin [Mucilaginibacter robiniae]
MESKQLQVEWTKRSLTDTLAIKRYLLRKLSPKELSKFYKLLQHFEKLVAIYPDLYPASTTKPGLHRAVLSKELSVYYTVSETKITVIAALDNRMDFTKKL